MTGYEDTNSAHNCIKIGGCFLFSVNCSQPPTDHAGSSSSEHHQAGRLEPLNGLRQGREASLSAPSVLAQRTIEKDVAVVECPVLTSWLLLQRQGGSMVFLPDKQGGEIWEASNQSQ